MNREIIIHTFSRIPLEQDILRLYITRMDEETILNLLVESNFGRAVGKNICSELVAHSKAHRYSAGTMIFQEGDAAQGIYFILQGMIKLTRISPDGRENVLHFVEPPHLFAEAAIFLRKYPATAIAMADCEVLFVNEQSVLDLVRRHEEFLRFLFHMMAQWLERLVAKIDQLTLNDGTSRVARYLLSLLAENEWDDSAVEVVLPVKKGDLADLLNINQPTLSRILRRLQDNHLIAVKARTIQFHDLGALRKLTLPPLD
jgi:CRP/FNR family transcriptional regulator, dissimilatory nitrate respiration regulator